MSFKLQHQVVIACTETGARKDEWKSRLSADAREANHSITDICLCWEEDRAVFKFEMPDPSVPTALLRQHIGRALGFADYSPLLPPVTVAECRFVVVPPARSMKIDSCTVVGVEGQIAAAVVHLSVAARQIVKGLPFLMKEQTRHKM